MATYIVEYTLPGERGKLHKKSFSSAEARKKFIDELKRKDGKVKSVSFHS